MVLLAGLVFVQVTSAQDVFDDPFAAGPVAEQAESADIKPAQNGPAERVKLFRPREEPTRSASRSYQSPTKMTAAELRQARALYRSQQRIQRLEMYQWMGYEPLRPNWATIPSMTSRYHNPVVYVPVYYYGR